MIELRWVERKKHFLDGKPMDMCGRNPGEIIECKNPASFRTEIERVLQYRQVVLHVDASGALTPLPNVTWSDWQDVPVVSEESSAPTL